MRAQKLVSAILAGRFHYPLERMLSGFRFAVHGIGGCAGRPRTLYGRDVAAKFAQTGGTVSAIDFLRRNLSFLKPPLEAIFSFEAAVAERWAAGAYHRLFLAQWGIHPLPEFFEHKIATIGYGKPRIRPTASNVASFSYWR
jgi:hypothetical protein